MQSHIEQETSSLPSLAIFGLYGFSGLAMLTYFSYRGFIAASHRVKVDRPPGQRLKLKYMKSLGGLYKALALSGLYLVGFGYLAYHLNLREIILQAMIRKDENYIKRVKLDPFFQNFYIINTMHYFGISQRLIKKTEQELRSKMSEKQQQTKDDKLVSFERSVLHVALKWSGEEKRLQQVKQKRQQ